MTKFTPEQQCAIETLDCNVSVSAGAGSGKTRVLVERFIKIISENKAGADGILAITFTRKAAKEMRERVRSTIYLLLKTGDMENRLFWQEQLKLLDKAQISTIDSFCSRLLRENPVEAQINPDFVTAEEFDMIEFYFDESSAYMKKLLREGDAGFRRLLAEYGRQRLQAMVNSLLERIPALANEADLTLPYSYELGEELEKTKNKVLLNIQLLLEIRETITGQHRDELDALSANIDLVREAVKNCRTDVLNQYLVQLSARNKKDSDLVKETRNLALRLQMVAVDSRALALIEDWQLFLRGLDKHFRDKKAEQNVLSFSDVEEKALHLLLDNRQVLAKYRNYYKYVMVDEFQDTNEQQKKLVYLVAGGNCDKLLDNRLFVVGDAKQSIYRFRGADVSVFTGVRKDIEKAGGKNIVLADNFRSSPEILQVCNNVFADLLGMSGNSEVVFQELKANRDKKSKPQLLIIETDKEQKRDAKTAEARVVANKIKELMSEDKKVEYGDIAILLAAINQAQIFAMALREAGIPYQIVDGKGFYERQEIIDVVNLLLVLDNSRRNLELAGVLRSPYLGISDETITYLLLTREENTLWQVLMNGNYGSEIGLEQQEFLKKAAKKLKKLQSVARTFPLPELFKLIYEVLQVRPLLAGQDFGWEKLANVNKLRSVASEFSMNQGGTLRTFLERVKKMREAETRMASAVGQPSKKTVTLMTIHKAKGLEFPVVFLPSLQAKGKNDTDSICFLPQVGLGIKTCDEKGDLVESSVFRKIKDTNKDLETDEKKRQLYVAMTRAEDYLFLSGISVRDSKAGKNTKEDWFASLQRILIKGTGNEVSADAEIIDSSKVKRLEQPTILFEEQTYPESIYEHIKPLPEFSKSRCNVFSASALQEYDTCPRSFYYRYLVQVPGGEELGFEREDLESFSCDDNALPANMLGLVIHSALEFIGKYSMEEALEYGVRKNVPPHLRGQAGIEAGRMLISYLHSPLYQEIGGLQKKTEEHFALPLLKAEGKEFWFTGSIDCLLSYDDGDLGIIDYKTGKPPLDGEEKKGYSHQLALYVLAAEKLYDKPVRNAELHFLQNNTKWSLPTDPSFLLKEITETCMEIRQKKEEQDFAALPQSCAFCSFSYLCPRR